MIAIIQGVAFSFLLVTAHDELFANVPITLRLTIWAQALAVLIAIIVVTDQYFQLIDVVRWDLGSLDTALPYIVGVGEVGAALYLGNNARWWGSIAALLLAGALAFMYSGRRTVRSEFEEVSKTYVFSHDAVRQSAIGCVALLVFAAAMVFISIYAAPPPWLFAVAPLPLIAVGIWALIP
jgi:hypothetical protein